MKLFKPFFAAATLLCSLAFATPAVLAQGEHEHGAGAPQADQARGEFDLRFIDMTTMHHEMGLKMNRLAEQKAQNAGLKAKARDMARTQQRDIDALTQLRARLYPDAPKHQMGSLSGRDKDLAGGQGTSGHTASGHRPGDPSTGRKEAGGMETMMAQIDRLEKMSGEEFDREFAKDMIRHHEMQIQMSERALEQAKHEEVRDIAKATLTSHKQDIADLERFAGPAR